MEVEDLFKSFEKEDNFHQEEVGSEPIVFIHDSYVKKRGQVFSFSDDEFEVLYKLLSKTKLSQDEFQFVAAIKGFGVTEKTATTQLIRDNRPILEDEIAKINPKLIFVLGNLAMKTLIRKSGINNKRGKEYWITVNDTLTIPVVPVFHPFSLYSEPKLRTLFVQDINNAYDKFILNRNRLQKSSYRLCNSLDAALEELDKASKKEVISIDLETTGLDFKKDVITSIGVGVGYLDAFVIPIYHRESNLSERDLLKVKEKMADIMADKNIGKVMHNCKFDLKFLHNWGITIFHNIHDTQIMHSLIDENKPHGLMDIVKEYWPTELEKF